jgi:hypothetical protein
MSVMNELDLLSQEIYGEFGFDTLNETEKETILNEFMYNLLKEDN